MKELSEQTQREINRYFRRLVKRQPMWMKILFDAEQIYFVIDPSGTLGLEVDSKLPDETKLRIETLIARYLNTHPTSFIIRREQTCLLN